MIMGFGVNDCAVVGAGGGGKLSSDMGEKM